MKKLELNQMENLEGGVTCAGAIGAVAGLTLGLLAATIVTGGAVLFAVGTIASYTGGGLLAGTACQR